MLQNTVPSIIQERRLEKVSVAFPKGISTIDKPTVKNTNATEIERRFVREWKKRSLHVKRSPIRAPKTRDPTISKMGFTKMETKSTLPCNRAFAMPNETANRILKDKNGDVIATVKDRISEIAPATVFHYGVTRRIAGAATAGLSAKVRATSFQKRDATNRATLSDARIGYGEAQTRLSGRITPPANTPWSALALHYQFLSADNKILGGSNEWFYKTSESTDTLTLSASVPVEIRGAAKLVFSADLDKKE